MHAGFSLGEEVAPPLATPLASNSSAQPTDKLNYGMANSSL